MNSSEGYRGWLHNLSEIAPGKSAILSGNTVTFYGIHGISIVIILLSLISCLTVIISVYAESKKKEKWDFSDRFPLYLAISDGVWAITNLAGDQIILLIYKQFPSKSVATMLSLPVAFFFGYQQLMNGGLSLYTYLRVVRRVSLDLGRLEWKLHLFAITFMVSNLAIFYTFDAYGSAGYWFLNNVNETGGTYLTLTICIFSTCHAILTLVAYRSIHKIINRQRSRLVSVHDPSVLIQSPHNHNRESCANIKGAGDHKNPQHYHSTATNCLTTFIYISICLYFPFAISAWMFFIESRFGFIEPTTVLLIVIGANSGGWVNALGYFHNKKIKNQRRNALNRRTMLTTSTSNSN